MGQDGFDTNVFRPAKNKGGIDERNADPSIAADVASAISGVARYYPEASEIFMYDLQAGQSYTVSCGGLSASTTVRVSSR